MSNLKDPLIKYRLHEQQISKTNPTIEPEVSTLILLSRWMRERGFKDFPSAEETPNQWISGSHGHADAHRKVEALLRQQDRRTAAQKVLVAPRVNKQSHKIEKLYRATRESPLEVLLTLIQRIFKYI